MQKRMEQKHMQAIERSNVFNNPMPGMTIKKGWTHKRRWTQQRRNTKLGITEKDEEKNCVDNAYPQLHERTKAF
jgi:hypothetical protein